MRRELHDGTGFSEGAKILEEGMSARLTILGSGGSAPIVLDLDNSRGQAYGAQAGPSYNTR